MNRRFAMAIAVWGALGPLAACEETQRAVLVIDAAPPKPPAPPTREGCARAGALEALETDPSCVVTRAPDDAMRTVMKDLAISLDIEPSEVVAGATALVHLTLKNRSSSEVTLYLEARGRPPGPRTDWSRVAGVPEPGPNAPDTPHLFFPMTTTDSYDRDVDAVPTVAGSIPVASTTILAVHLRPGAKLVRALSWWALSIPAPAPIVKDDAGHRYVPKTVAVPLYAGSYTVTLELPLLGLEREERKVKTHVRVTRVPLLDGGARHP